MVPPPKTIGLDKLLDEIKASHDGGRTPLILDNTGPGKSPVDTFFLYSGHMVLDLKQVVVEVNVLKTSSLADALASAREKVVLAMKRGYYLVLALSNAAPPFKSQLASPTHLPEELLDASLVAGLKGGSKDLADTFVATLRRSDDDLWLVHDDFDVVVISKFEADEVEEFLGAEWPLEHLQPIRVVAGDS